MVFFSWFSEFLIVVVIVHELFDFLYRGPAFLSIPSPFRPRPSEATNEIFTHTYTLYELCTDSRGDGMRWNKFHECHHANWYFFSVFVHWLVTTKKYDLYPYMEWGVHGCSRPFFIHSKGGIPVNNQSCARKIETFSHYHLLVTRVQLVFIDILNMHDTRADVLRCSSYSFSHHQ